MDATTLLRVPEVAEMLRVPRARVYDLGRRGLLPVVRMGRQVRVHPEELEEWLRSGGRGLATGEVERDWEDQEAGTAA